MNGLRVGQEFAGHRIDAQVGQGGMGVVYRATHLALERAVALKLIAPQLASDEEFRERFKRESRAAASIKHPHVITVFHAGEDDGQLYITMDFIEGTDLGAMLSTTDRLEPETAAELIAQVADGLDAAHARGMVHRDVKPANILVEHRGGRRHAYLTDFGLTRETSSTGGLTTTGQWIGTLDYVAPEQIQGEATSARADVYSLGCVLVEAVTGEVAFPRDSEVPKLWAHMTEPPPDPLERVPELPVGLREVVARAMAKDPADRYLSAGDLGRAAVAAALGDEPPSAEVEVARGAAGSTISGAAAPPAAAPAAGPAQAPEGVGPDSRPTPPMSDSRPTPPMSDSRPTPPRPAAPTESAARRARSTEAAAPQQAAAVPTAGEAVVPPPPAKTAQTPPAHLRRRRLVLLAGIAAGAIGAGYVIGAVLGGESTSTASGEVVDLQYEEGWAEDLSGGRLLDGLQLRDPVALDYEPLSGQGILRAGLSADPVPGEDPLPDALAERFAKDPAGEEVSLNGLAALSYRGTERQKGGPGLSVQVYMLPTNEGWVAIGCEAPIPDAEPFLNQCETVAGSVELAEDVRPGPLSPDAGYADELGPVLAALTDETGASQDLLQENNPGQQAEGATRQSDAFAEAADRLDEIAPPLQDAAAHADLAEAARESGGAWEDLAAAARAEKVGAYRAASERIDAADAAFEAALVELERHGYELQAQS